MEGLGSTDLEIKDCKFCGLQYFGLDLLKLVVGRPIRFNLDFFSRKNLRFKSKDDFAINKPAWHAAANKPAVSDSCRKNCLS